MAEANLQFAKEIIFQFRVSLHLGGNPARTVICSRLLFGDINVFTNKRLRGVHGAPYWLVSDQGGCLEVGNH
jgi:hypothetical protein